jgi:tetratricopeptide (TPR) repeat protein
MAMRVFMLALVWLALIAQQAHAERIIDAMDTEELKKALVLVEMGHFDEALELAGDCAAETKDAAPCRFIHARALAGKEKYREAAQAYRDVYYGTKNIKLKEDALFNRSRMYGLAKYDLEARAGYLLFLKEFPKSERAQQAQLGLADLNLVGGKPEDALKGYEAAGYVSGALYGKADVLQMTGRTKEAEEAYKIALDADREYLVKSDEALYYYGENLMQTGKYKKASETLMLVKNQPLKDLAYINLGLIKIREKNPSKAAEFFKIAAASADRRIKGIAYTNMAQADIASKKPDEAEKDVTEALKNLLSFPKEADAARLIRSDILRGQGKYAESVKLLREVIAARRLADDATDRLVEIYREMLDKDAKLFVELWDSSSSYLVDRRREEFLLKAVEALRGTGKPFLDLAMWLAKYGTDATKVKFFRELVQFYDSVGDVKNARKYLALMRKAVGENDDIYRLEADLLYAEGKSQEALGKIFLLKQLKKEDLTTIRATVGQAEYPEQTAAFYDKAVQEVGGDVRDRLKLADLYMNLGKRQEALGCYRKVVEEDPKNEWALFRLATLTEGPEAEKSLEMLSKLGSTLGSYARGAMKEPAIDRKLSEVF